jgi:hypothetical protein
VSQCVGVEEITRVLRNELKTSISTTSGKTVRHPNVALNMRGK